MLTKNRIKEIQSLENKKGRTAADCFIVEGDKSVHDTLPYFVCEELIATPRWLNQHTPTGKIATITEITEREMAQLSLQKSPGEVIAIYRQPHYTLHLESLKETLTLALDTVQDPGNMGTIIRLADWFGIDNILCSPDCADLYNPKTIQATMGSIARVKVHYCSLPHTLQALQGLPIYGTFLKGENIYQAPLTTHGIIIMGNEGKGISAEVEQYVNRRLFIPPYPLEAPTGESLNVAMATAVTCALFRR